MGFPFISLCGKFNGFYLQVIAYEGYNDCHLLGLALLGLFTKVCYIESQQDDYCPALNLLINTYNNS